MSEFFNLTIGLSAYSKWVLIRLIAKKTIGDELSKSELIELGCPHNKFKKVIEELQEINAISKLEAEHFKPGRPTLSYTFIYNSHDKIDRLKFTEMLAKVEGLELRVPIKLVWCFFVLNQDEFGYVENFSVSVIAKACKLKNVEVKTAIIKLVESKKIQQLATGCTFKENEPFTCEKNRLITKRPSAYTLSIPNNNSPIEHISTALVFNLLSSKKIKKDEYVGQFFNSLPTNINRRYRALFDIHLNNLFSGDSFELVKSYLADQPKNSIDNFRNTLNLLTVKCIKKILSYKNPKQHLSTLDVSNSLFGTTNIFQIDSKLYHLSNFITSFINIYVHSLLFISYAYFEASDSLRVKTYREYIYDIDNVKADVFVLKRYIFLCLNKNNLTSEVRVAFSSRIN